MELRTYLESVVDQVEGALVCSIMGYDGIAVETHSEGPVPEEWPVEHAGAEYAHLLTQVKKAAQTLRSGAVTEMSVSSERVSTLMRPINEHYFLVLAIRSEANIGKARFLLRTVAPRLGADL